MSVPYSTQARRSGSRRDMGVGRTRITYKATVNEPDRLALHGEMSVREWRGWRRRIQVLLAHPLPLTQRGFLEGQLFRLGHHPVDAEEAEPPCSYAIKRIEEIERRRQ